MTVLRIIIALVPVLLFLAGLTALDSYKLIPRRRIFLIIAGGIIAAGIAFTLNTKMMQRNFLSEMHYSRYLAPIIEESLKLAIPLMLVFRKKIGFMVDAAIAGFAAGTGFALAENAYYLVRLGADANLLTWGVRGLGTALMHGSTSAVALIILLSGHGKLSGLRIISGWAASVILHSLFNHFPVSPVLMTLVQIIVFPLIAAVVFQLSEQGLKNWLDTGFDSDVALLDSIRSGQMRSTPAGQYLIQLKSRFSGEDVVDMLCCLRLQLELAVSAKGLLLMREAGFNPPAPSGTKDKFAELNTLRSSLGPLGLRAISPLLHHATKDLWQLHFLGDAAKGGRP